MHAMKVYGGVAVELHVFFTLVFNGVISFVFQPLILYRKAPYYCGIWGWVGPRVGLNLLEKRGTCFFQNLNLEFSVVKFVV